MVSRGSDGRIIPVSFYAFHLEAEANTHCGGPMFTALLLALMLPAGTQSQPPRDRAATRSAPVDPAAREAELQRRIAASPRGAAAYIELARLQEDRGSSPDAQGTLARARATGPESKE